MNPSTPPGGPPPPIQPPQGAAGQDMPDPPSPADDPTSPMSQERMFNALMSAAPSQHPASLLLYTPAELQQHEAEIQQETAQVLLALAQSPPPPSLVPHGDMNRYLFNYYRNPQAPYAADILLSFKR